MPDGTRTTASALLREGSRLAIRPPFVWLIGLAVFATLATAPIETEDAGAFIGVILVSLISFYSAIGLTLAAAEGTPDASPEVWIRAALSRRCLLRSLLTLLFATVLVAAGLLAFIVPGLIVGAYVALAETAAILENHRPGDAVRRSMELTKPARRPIGIVYALLVIVPGAALQLTLYFIEVEPAWIRATMQCATLALSSIAQIAMTKAFLELGGRKLTREAPAPTPEGRVP